jgi:hypothetical protein
VDEWGAFYGQQVNGKHTLSRICYCKIKDISVVSFYFCSVFGFETKLEAFEKKIICKFLWAKVEADTTYTKLRQFFF